MGFPEQAEAEAVSTYLPLSKRNRASISMGGGATVIAKCSVVLL